jgi:simple sugar transport system permease protein
VAVGFKTGLFNIGTPGQYTAGGVTALYLAILFPPIPVLHIIVCLVGAILAGAIVGLIPGLLKAFFNISEVITSIMLNYITTYGAIIFVNNPKVRDIQSAMIKINFSSTAKLYSFGIGKLDIGIIIAIISIIIVSIVLFKTKFGYKLRAVGLNKDASKYAGMNTKLLTILAMVIAGGLAGLAAVLSFLPKTPSAMMRAENTVRAIGFDGIFIALIGGSDPFGVGLSALFISFLREGSTSVQLYGFSKEAVDVIIGVIIYLVAIQSFIRVFINKWPNFFKKLFKKKGKEVINE